MAVIQYTGAVNQIRGKLNGSTFNKARTSSTLQRKQQQPQGSRGLQSGVRNVFSFVQRTWSQLSPQVRLDWQTVADNNPDRDRFGDQVILSGYNKYLQSNIFAMVQGGNFVYAPDVSTAPPLTLFSETIDEVVWSTNPDGTTQLHVDYNASMVPMSPGCYCGLYVSLPVNAGVTVYHGRYQHVFGDQFDGEAGFDVGVNLGSHYPLPRSGQYVIWKSVYAWQGNGVVVSTNYHIMHIT